MKPTITVNNIFESAPGKLDKEFIEELVNNNSFKLERIISDGHSSPEDFWYDQDKNEFVLLISGKAKLEFENDGFIELNAGDYLIIPARKKHRVVWTDPDQKTFWLILHY